MEQENNWGWGEPIHRDKEPLEGSWAVSDPVRMASAEPLSLKGTTRKGGEGGAIIFRNGTNGWGGTGEGWAGLELTAAREGSNRAWVSPPHLTQAW